ncbi:Uncharacterized protein FWK35_00030300, partial [Aphis craccivora]
MSASSPSISNDDTFRKLIDMFNDLKSSQNKIIHKIKCWLHLIQNLTYYPIILFRIEQLESKLSS